MQRRLPLKIVVLDGYTLNPGDLSWDGLRELGECAIHDRTGPDLVLERSQGAGVLLTNKTVLDGETIKALPDLRYIGVLATGYNVLDLEAARECGSILVGCSNQIVAGTPPENIEAMNETIAKNR